MIRVQGLRFRVYVLRCLGRAGGGWVASSRLRISGINQLVRDLYRLYSTSLKLL